MEITRDGRTLEAVKCIVKDMKIVPTGPGVDIEDIGKNWLEHEICRWANNYRKNVTFEGDTAYVDASNVEGTVIFADSEKREFLEELESVAGDTTLADYYHP